MLGTDRESKFAKLLLSLRCVQISPDKPYTYASGLLGPIYTDNRQILSFVPERLEVAEALAELIKKSGLSYDSIAGLATAGIPHGMLVAHILKVPFIYVRSSAKGHGKANQIEGKFKAGDKVFLIEDLVNQGSSLNKAIDAIREAKLIPVACAAIVDYQMPAAIEVIEKQRVPLFSLTNFTSITHAASADGALSKESQLLLSKWHKDPINWP